MSDVSFLTHEVRPEEPQRVLDVPAVDMTGPAKPRNVVADMKQAARRQPTRRRGPAARSQARSGAIAPRRREGGDMAPTLTAVTQAVAALAEAAKAQQREISELRARLDGIKSLLG